MFYITKRKETKQSEKATYGMIPSIWHSGKRQDYGGSKKFSDCQEW